MPPGDPDLGTPTNHLDESSQREDDCRCLDEILDRMYFAAFDRARELDNNNCAEISSDQGPLDFSADYDRLLTDAAEKVVTDAGLDPAEFGGEIFDTIEQVNAEVSMAWEYVAIGGGREEAEAAQSFFAALPQVRRSVGKCGNRHRRASRPAANRRRGSRRAPAARAGPDDDPHELASASTRGAL